VFQLCFLGLLYKKEYKKKIQANKKVNKRKCIRRERLERQGNFSNGRWPITTARIEYKLSRGEEKGNPILS